MPIAPTPAFALAPVLTIVPARLDDHCGYEQCPLSRNPQCPAVVAPHPLSHYALQNAILGSANFSIIATDATGIIQLFNTGAEHMLGYLAKDVVNQLRPSDLHDPQEVITHAKELSLEFNTPISPGFDALAFKASRGIEDVYELTYICKDKSRFPAIVSITALRDDYQAIIGYLLIGADNSLRKKAAQELQRAKLAAEEANRAKSDFLSSMSHELRTPLSAILGFAQLIESGTPPPTPAQQRGLNQILQGGWYLLDLINEILDLALIESGKLSLSLEPVSLAEVFRECEAMIEPQAHKRSIGLHFPNPVPDLANKFCVHADRTRVKQILLNLLSNAIKYNRVGGRITVACAEMPNAFIRVSVEDTGQGLAPEQLAQLFQPFNRLGKEAKQEQGTGIGLVVTKRLTELMGGNIGLHSTPGSGSTFWIEFKSTSERHAAPVAHESLPTRAKSVDTSAPKRTLLYVEDNPANLLLVEELIARRPDVVLFSARDGDTGFALARSLMPDVVLMDINLPGISGVQAMRMLADDPLTRHIPVLALSANAIPRDIERGLEAGFYRYLTKPIKVQIFQSALDDAFTYADTKK